MHDSVLSEQPVGIHGALILPFYQQDLIERKREVACFLQQPLNVELPSPYAACLLLL